MHCTCATLSESSSVIVPLVASGPRGYRGRAITYELGYRGTYFGHTLCTRRETFRAKIHKLQMLPTCLRQHYQQLTYASEIFAPVAI